MTEAALQPLRLAEGLVSSACTEIWPVGSNVGEVGPTKENMSCQCSVVEHGSTEEAETHRAVGLKYSLPASGLV